MEFFERYDKKVIEEFALRVTSKSYDLIFSTYVSPNDTDNFDFVSIDGAKALEVTTVISENEISAYIYEKELSKGKKKLSVEKIRDAKLKEDGTLAFWYGGGLNEIKNTILTAIEKKHSIAIHRMKNTNIKLVDLCICMVDGSLYDLRTFEIAFHSLEKYIFKNIFFITPSYFIRYSKEAGFQEYTKCI